MIELLVVIAVIAVLMGIILPVMNRVRRQAKQIMCATNLSDWGRAYHMYASANDDFFPYNGPAKRGVKIGGGLSPCSNSSTVQQFWNDYLYPIDEHIRDKFKHTILFCPTDQICPTARETVEEWLQEGLISYYTLPHRMDRSTNEPFMSLYDFDPQKKGASTQGWVTRKKFGQRFCRAPIATDKIQFGIYSPDAYYFNDRGQAHCNHAKSNGKPEGGNFLYEDGSVLWSNFSRISMSAKSVFWDIYFKPKSCSITGK
ncbi:MAG: type II secretion system protein [Phycisphaerales bacterium]|nr:MAG: type II secretion system protein [Phycisphaerales bacterium]